jgi:hypothetical protein
VASLLTLALSTSSLWGQDSELIHDEQVVPLSADPESGRSADETASWEAMIQQRLAASPQDASAWRMLGQLALERGAPTEALDAFRRAIQLDRLNVAAYFGLGTAAQQLDRYGDAELAFQHVIELAPESEYAIDAETALAQLPGRDTVLPVNYELRTFDGSDLAPLIAEPLEDPFPTWSDRLEIRTEVGSQFNSNVGLAPSSRELSADTSGGAQALASFTAKWYVYDTERFRIGPMFDSDFTLNEGQLQRFNLQSYRPGFTTNGQFTWRGRLIRPRATYLFTHDEFDGSTFGNRHSLSTSLGTVWSASQITTAYWSIDKNFILNDGLDPDVTSQDGWSNTIGLLHDHIRRNARWQSFRLGADFQNADTVGSNFRFRAVSVYGQSVLVLTPKVKATFNAGWTFRDYYDFTGDPTRDTHIVRVGGELRRAWGRGVSTALVSQYTNFDSPNPNFATDRFLAGLLCTWDY